MYLGRLYDVVKVKLALRNSPCSQCIGRIDYISGFVEFCILGKSRSTKSVWSQFVSFPSTLTTVCDQLKIPKS